MILKQALLCWFMYWVGKFISQYRDTIYNEANGSSEDLVFIPVGESVSLFGLGIYYLLNNSVYSAIVK